MFKLTNMAVSIAITILVFLVLPQDVRAQEDWWDTDFQYRQQLTIGEATEAYTGYTVKLKFDPTTVPSAATMYAKSISFSKGDDFRIVYNGAEIDRDMTSFNPTLIEIWFKVQADIIGGPDATSYIFYYGNSNATTPPANKSDLYLWFDDFNRADNPDITTEISYSVNGSAGTWSIETNKLKNVGASGDPNKLIITTLGNIGTDIDMLVKFKVTSFIGGDQSRMGLSCCMDNRSGYCALFHYDTSSLDLLNDRRSWGTRGNYAWSLDTWYYMRFRVIDPANRLGKVKVWRVGTTEPNTWTLEGNFGRGSARSYGNVGFAGSRRADTTYFDDILIRYITEPEPLVSAGPEESGNPNGQQPPPGFTGKMPYTIRFQGMLGDYGGEPLEGEFTLTFRLYDVDIGGLLLWEEIQEGINIEGGLLDVGLGSVTALDLAFDKQYWLGVEIESDGEMIPRFKLTSVPYAFMSKK